MYDKIFKRIEKKYVLNKDEYELLLKRIKPYIIEDEYFASTINNIYFDTQNHDLIIKSLEKPIFKEKVRLRSYDTPDINDYVFWEVKTKYKRIVGKRRIKIKLKDFYDYIKKSKMIDNQIFKELDYIHKHFNLIPAIYIGYDRMSFKGKEDNNLRITFDSNLRSRKDNLYLEYGDEGKNFFEDDIKIMEIKALGGMPLWLARALSEMHIYPASFSKYGEIYKKECLNVK